MNVIIVGCTYTGRRLADRLSRLGHGVTVVDSDKSNFEKLTKGHNFKLIAGEETDAQVLKLAGAEKADAAAVVTEKDNVNIMAAQIIKFIFSLENVYVSLNDSSREDVFRKLGLRTVCATRMESETLLSLITDTSDDIEPINIGGVDISFSEVKAHKGFYGMEPMEVFREDGEMLFAVRKGDGRVFLSNESGVIIEEGDWLIYAVI